MHAQVCLVHNSAWCRACKAAWCRADEEAGLLDHHHRDHVLQAEDGSDGLRALENEIGIIKELGQNPHITEARALATLEKPGNDRKLFGLAMACCPGGSLADLSE